MFSSSVRLIGVEMFINQVGDVGTYTLLHLQPLSAFIEFPSSSPLSIAFSTPAETVPFIF